MWPMLIDMSRDECKRMLRRLELEAYSAIISAFRAQGDLNKDKKKILQDLCSVLSISTERHRAEIRRAVNDEHLSTIADQMVGPNTSSEWAIEGRRLVPLMPRLVPQTAFTPIATHVANFTAAQNAQMLPPSATGNKYADCPPASTPSPIMTPTANQSPVKQILSPRPATPPSLAINSNSVSNNVVILPSGMSVHVRGQNGSVLEEERGRKRRRSSSFEQGNQKSPQRETSPGVNNLQSKVSTLPTRQINVPLSGTPVKITFTSTPQKFTTTMTNAPTQKVILLSGQGLTPSLLQRSLSVPIVKTVTATGTTISVAQPKTTSLIMPSTTVTAAMPSHSNGNVGTIVTLTSTAATHSNINTSANTFSTTTVSGSLSSALSTAANTFTIGKGRGARQKGKIATTTGLMIPVVSQAQSSTVGIQLKPITTTTTKPTIQVKNDAGLKIITQTVSGQPITSAKILPKPSTVGNTSASVVMMTSPVTKTIPSTSTSGIGATRVVNVITSAQSTPNKTTTPTSAVVTVNPKNLQTGTVKLATLTSTRYKTNLSDASGSGVPTPALIMVGPKALQATTVKMLAKNAVARSTQSTKPNLIVVQKAQVMPSTGSGAAGTTSLTQTLVKHVAFRGQREKDLLSFVQRGEKVKISTSQGELAGSSGGRSVVLVEVSGQGKGDEKNGDQKNTVLADILQATGILPEQTGQSLCTIEEYEEEAQSVVEEEKVEERDENEDPQSTEVFKWVGEAREEQVPEFIDISTGESKKIEESASEVVSALYPFGMQENQMLEIQTAADVLGHKGELTEETITLLTQAGFDFKKLSQQTEEESVETKDDLSEEEIESKETDLGKRETDRSGQLDPQTGIFYPNDTATPSGVTLQTEDKTEEGKAEESTSSLDIFTTAIESAQLDLRQFNYVDDDLTRVNQSKIEVLVEEEEEEEEEPKRESQEFEVESVSVEEAPPMIVDDFNSQRVEEVVTQEFVEEEVTSEVVLSSTDQFEDDEVAKEVEFEDHLDDGEELVVEGSSGFFEGVDAKVRSSKRKRKAPNLADDVPPHLTGWARHALGLLNKVSNFRGKCRGKLDYTASHWFQRPVSPTQAPDYYKVIEKPMDFSTVRRNLENGIYNDIFEFHNDMNQIKVNCELYNPSGHPARVDCTEVFIYYNQEYEKIMDKLNKPKVIGSSTKKTKQI